MAAADHRRRPVTGDGRISAWATAWSMLEGASKLRDRVLEADSETPLPDAYWGLLYEAHAFAALASTPADVGFPVAMWLQDVEQQRREQQENTARREKEFLDRNDPSCTCEWDRSQCTIHGGGEDIEDDDVPA